MRPVTEIIIHCAATPEGKHFTAADIDRWHREQGWAGIGYHYVVLLDGTVEIGRPLDKIGAHVSGRNENTIGVVYIGGLDAKGQAKDTRTDAQKAALLKLCRELLDRYPSIKTISGHNQYAAKACPSFDVRKDPLGSLPKERAAKPVAPATPAASVTPSIEDRVAALEAAVAELTAERKGTKA